MRHDQIAAQGQGWAVIALSNGARLVEFDHEGTAPGFYVGIASDPRREPVRLTPNYASMTDAVRELAALRLTFPKSEIFYGEGA